MDGLSNISETHPHFTPEELKPGQVHEHLEISSKKSYEAILDLLREEPEKTVSIVALGPCECIGGLICLSFGVAHGRSASGFS
jgi:hypothetical protein